MAGAGVNVKIVDDDLSLKELLKRPLSEWTAESWRLATQWSYEATLPEYDEKVSSRAPASSLCKFAWSLAMAGS